MNTKLTAALACAAALALGACSGGNPPASADPDPDPAAPGNTDPVPGTMDPVPETDDPPADDRTEAERFDDAQLEEAAADLAAARSRVVAAVAAAARTGGDRTMALANIAAARKALTDALAAARALQAPSDDSERTARAAKLAVKADAAEAEDLPRLRAAESSAGAGWAASSLVIGRESLRPVPELQRVVRNPRRENGADAETLLTAAKIPAVAYEDGKVVMSPGLASSGDLLQMRGIPIFQAGTAATGNARQFLFYGPLNLPEPYLDPIGGGNNGGDPRLVAGLTITPGGLVVDMGGKGAPGLDLRFHSLFANGFQTVAPDGSNDGYDLKLTFGPPGASPEGNAEHYWTATLMPSSDHVTTLGNRLSAGRELGTYIMRLSNHVGLDRNLEDPDDPAASARDDVNRYLSYAAYGHMEFFDSFVRSGNFVAGQVAPGRRTFPFHAGYDAFKDEAGMRTTDVAEADKIVGGTFRGRTLASQFAIAMLAWALVLSSTYRRRLPDAAERLLLEAAGRCHADRDNFRNRGRQQDQRKDHESGILQQQQEDLGRLCKDLRRSDAPSNWHRSGWRVQRRHRHRFIVGFHGGRLQGEFLRAARRAGGGRNLVSPGRHRYQ